MLPMLHAASAKARMAVPGDPLLMVMEMSGIM
jgi:hypothetical protein